MIDYFEEMLQKTMEIIAIDTVQAKPCAISPFGKGVGLCIEKTMDVAKKLGFTVNNQSGYYGTACIGSGEEFGILGHLDTVPYNAKDWTHSPLGEIYNDTIYGRGILDDKGPMMCCLYATYKLIQEGYVPKKKIKFIFGGNEESGWKCIEKYNELETMPETGISPDADFPVINCEKGISEIKVKYPCPNGLISITGGDRANIVMDSCEAIYNGVLKKPKDKNVTILIKEGKTFIKATGIAAHGSLPKKGDNALWHIINYLYDNVPDSFMELKKLICHNDGSGVGLKLSDQISGNLSFNAGMVNTVKTDANETLIEFTFDIRFPISYTKEFIAESVSKAFNSYATISHFHDPLYVDKKDPLVECLLKAYNSITNSNESPITIGGGTYARALKHGVAFGPIFPGQESTIHQKDERVEIEYFKKTFEIYYEAIKLLCF